jgi:hypothetical protein
VCKTLCVYVSVCSLLCSALLYLLCCNYFSAVHYIFLHWCHKIQFALSMTDSLMFLCACVCACVFVCVCVCICVISICLRRKRLSAVTPLFDFDFQNFDVHTGSFGYRCLLIEVTEAGGGGGLLDSLGLWFNLYLDQERALVLSNAPHSFVTAPAAAATCSAGSPGGNASSSCLLEKVSHTQS